MYDLILKGGRIYDGSGLPSFIGDVAIRDGRIEEIGRIHAAAEHVLDVEGLAVAPGIIDFHTHFDAQLWWDPLASTSHEHGVTTVVTGNCGLTLAPCKPESRDALIGTFVRVEAMPRASLQAGIPWKWSTHGEFLDALERKPLGLNVATLVGHCAVRQYAMGEASVEREANDAEIGEMEELVRQGMNAGAFGFSTNSNQSHYREDGKPVASRFAALDEIARLCRVVGESQRGLVQFTHGAFATARACRAHQPMVRYDSQRNPPPVDRREHPPSLERARFVAQAVERRRRALPPRLRRLCHDEHAPFHAPLDVERCQSTRRNPRVEKFDDHATGTAQGNVSRAADPRRARQGNDTRQAD